MQIAGRIGIGMWLLWIGTFSLSAQVKYEQEEKIKATAVPVRAFQFIDSLPLKRAPKWFRETRLLGYSFEAKFKCLGHHYSVEFDSLGTFEDVEINWKEKELPIDAWERIKEDLGTKFAKFRLQKIQIQYSGPPALILPVFERLEFEHPPQMRIRYELQLKGKQGGGYEWYEMTYSEEGDWIKTDKIIFQPIDHLIY